MTEQTTEQKINCPFCENETTIKETDNHNLFIVICNECERNYLISKQRLETLK
jgi:transcription elongation factor Elf1